MSLYFCLRETADITAFLAGASPLQPEPVSVNAALGRVLAADMHAPVPCPSTVTRTLHLDQTPLIFAQMAFCRTVPDVAHRLYFFD